MISATLTQRSHEPGVRVAPSAQPGALIGLSASQGLRFAIAGVVLGAGLALIAGRWLQPLLFQQSASDPRVYATVGAAMIIVALAASTVPALRAAKADPNVALRSD